MKKTGSEGFTLIELMIVLVIIGVMAALAVPSFSGDVQHYTLKTAASKVVAAARYAQSQAVMENTNWQLEFLSANPAQVVVKSPSGAISESWELPGITYGSMVFGGIGTNVTTYDSFGNTVHGYVYLHKNGEQISVVFDPLGRVRIVR